MTIPGYYILLPDHTVGRAIDLITWARWMEGADRIVAKSELGSTAVSTVFLGLDHRWGEGAPLLFETLVFGGLLDGEMERYSTWSDAEAGHLAMCERIRAVTKESSS